MGSTFIRYGGSKACFVPSLDVVQLPPRNAFESVERYFATALHELAHNAVIRIMPHGGWRRWNRGRPAMQRFGIIRAPPEKRGVCRQGDIVLVSLAARSPKTTPSPSSADRHANRPASSQRIRDRARA